MFNKSLMREAFRQSKVIFILTAVCMGILAILIPVAEYFSLAASDYYAGDSLLETTQYAYILNGPLMALPGVTAIFVLRLFSFQNSRNASDFFHALPYKRKTMYASFTLTIVLMDLVILVGSELISLICSLLCHSLLPMDYSTVFPYVMTIFCLCLLVLGGFLVGMSLSGHWFNNLVLSGIILFLPRTVVEVIRSVVENKVTLMPAVSYDGIFTTENNLLFGVWIHAFDGKIFPIDISAFIYTLILAGIYVVLGGLLFCRRKSEIAGLSAPSPMYQHIYRILVTFVYTFLITCLAYGIGVKDNWYILIILYVLGLFLYYIYEAISMRGISNFAKTLPGIGIVIGLNLLVVGILFGMETYEVSLQQEAQETKSISVLDTELYDYCSYYSLCDYDNEQEANLMITDQDAIQAACDALQDNTQKWKEDSENYDSNCLEDEDYYQQVTIIYHKNGKDLTRQIWVTEEQYNIIQNAKLEMQEYADIYHSVPEYSSLDSFDLYMCNTTNYCATSSGFELSDEELEEVYELYQQELEQADLSQISSILSSGNELADLSYTLKSDTTKTITLPISKALTPITAEWVEQKWQSANQVILDEFKNATFQLDENGDIEEVLADGSTVSLSNIWFNVYDVKGYSYYGDNSSWSNEEVIEVLQAMQQYGDFDCEHTLSDTYVDMGIEGVTELYFSVDQEIFDNAVLENMKN